jgi:hypothetical protein
MLTAQHTRGSIGAIVLFIALANSGNHALADGFDDQDFSLRFPAALTLPPPEELRPAASGGHPSIRHLQPGKACRANIICH